MHSTKTAEDVRFSEEVSNKAKNLPYEPDETLIKYEQPSLQAIRKRGGRYVPQKPFAKKPISYSVSEARLNSQQCDKVNINVDEDALYNEAELKQLLENLYPPIEWKQSNCVYSKTVSTSRGTTEDIIKLADKIKHITDAPSPKLFSTSQINQKQLLQAFDEVIRQTLVEKPLVGLLLKEVRDNVEKYLEVRRSVFASNIAFSMRKEFQFTKEIEDFQEQLEEIKSEKMKLRLKITRLTEERESAEARHKHLLEADYEEFQNEVQPLLNEKRRMIIKLKHIANIAM